MAKEILPVKSEFLLYQSKDGKTKLQTRMFSESVWLSLKELSELFDIDKSGISRHLKNIFESGELSRDAVVASFAITASDGKTYRVEHYNLDAIISVGYRVNSIIGTHFRQWATGRLREYIVKGFTMDDERLKQAGGGSYFDELLARTGTSAPRKRSFGVRCWISMLPALTMILGQKFRRSSLRSFRTRCTGQVTVILQLR